MNHTQGIVTVILFLIGLVAIPVAGTIGQLPHRPPLRLSLSFNSQGPIDIGESNVPESKLKIDVGSIDRKRILRAAVAALKHEPVTITAFPAKFSEGGLNDFYSNGDYWWPDPSKPNGLPYIRRDGETNPDNFVQHRLAVKALRDSVAALAAAYKLTGDDRYVAKAVKLLRVFFLDGKTRMSPHLNFAQAIPGVSPGRGIGIIDALHLIEVPIAIRAIEKSKAFPAETGAGLRQWFRALADWMSTSRNGKAVAFLYPFLADKSKWTRKPDVQAWEGWPARQPALIFAGIALGEQRYLDLWQKLNPDPTDPEVQRNIAITQPLLWLR